MVVFVTCAGTITSVTDSTGNNTYTLANANIGTPTAAIYYSVIVTGGTVTVTANGSLTQQCVGLAEYSFDAGTISLASTNQGQGSGTQVSGAYLTFGTQPALVSTLVAGATGSLSFTPNPLFSGSISTSGGAFYGLFTALLENAVASPVIPGGSFNIPVAWATTSAVFVSSGDTTPSILSAPFSQAYAGGNVIRSNAGHY